MTLLDLVVSPAYAQAAGQPGMLGGTIPEEYGGAGLAYVDYVNVIEELGVIDSGFALSVAAHNSLGTGHIYLAGNDGIVGM